jgi:lysophospholipase L1-like esterase
MKTNNPLPFEIRKKGTSNEEIASQLAQSAKQSDLEIERARITNLATLSAGSTTGDAELIDSRVAGEGTVFSSSGNNIRAISSGKGFARKSLSRKSLSDDIFQDSSLEVISASFSATFGAEKAAPIQVRVYLPSSVLITKVNAKYSFRNKGKITSLKTKAGITGVTTESTVTAITGINEIDHNITCNTTASDFLVYIWGITPDSTSAFDIENLKVVVNDTIIPTSYGAPAVAFANGTVNKQTFTFPAVAKKTDITNGQDWSTKKWLIFGDSISDDDFFATKSHYYDKIKADTGILTYPYAVGGSGYATNTTNPPAVAKWGATNNVLTQIDNQGQANPDYVSIEAGTNDWGFTSCALGSVADILVTNSTFYSLVAQAVRKVKNKYPYAKMFVMTLLPRSDLSEYRTKLNTNNNSMEQFNQAIRDVCAYYSVPVLDMYRLSQLHSDELQPNWWYDSLHPSETYQTTVFANLVYNFIKSI